MKRFVYLFIAVVLFGCTEDNTEPIAIGPKLKSMTTYLQKQSGEFRPGEKVEYQYNAEGKLIGDTQSQYDIVDKAYYTFSTSAYLYNGSQLSSIEKRYDGQTNKVITKYEYDANNKVSKITEETEGVDTEATINYLEGNKIEIIYNHSNGRWFIYRFTIVNNNKNDEQTIGDDNELASEVNHVFDSGKNPLSLLGYADLFFSSASANNKIKTESNYIKAPYPQSTPISYTYEYNELGYPTQQITTYKSLGSSGFSSMVMVKYEYQ